MRLAFVMCGVVVLDVTGVDMIESVPRKVVKSLLKFVAKRRQVKEAKDDGVKSKDVRQETNKRKDSSRGKEKRM